MFISVKLQFIHCKDHTLLWTSALNRFDSLLKFSSSPETKESISYALKQYEEHFSKLSQGKVHAIRVGILNLLLDLRFKVSTFQRLELQNSDGDFILRPYNHQCSGGSIGQINYFDWNGEFTDGQKFIPTTRHQQTSGLLEGPNSRGTWLGMDIYDYDYPKTDHQMSNEKGDEAEPKRQPRILCNFEGETLAKNELGFLTRLIRPEHFERVQERAQESESVQANSIPLDCELNQTSHEKVQSSSAQYKETIQIVRRNSF
ncbi:hypothetical protein TCAL_10464 [Tigriopus californicus]|uniref:Uncharacterized protein n=2 Tax=Tigriopus californicus TaxID=6832 RepID=A0A553PID1_TIGCA|nr:hypothetical protein TCAL_10464 [Tigriopus californicus]